MTLPSTSTDEAAPTVATPRDGRPDETRQHQGRPRWLVPAILVALVLAGVIVLAGPFGTDPVDEAPPSDLPTELDDAFRDLERSVRP